MSLYFSLSSTVAWAHDDVVPYYSGGQLLTGGHDDGAGTNNLSQTVFGLDFHEDPLDPYFAGDPGFNNGGFAIGVFPNDGLLPTGETLAFNLRTNLLYWDGVSAVGFSSPPADVTLGLNRGSNTVTISGTGSIGTLPTVGSTGASGRLHVHFGSYLNSLDGISPSAPNAAEGIYLIGIELKLTDPNSASPEYTVFSEPIFFVYNNGLDEEVHDEAISWVEVPANQAALLAPVPEPAAGFLASAGVVGLATVVRRRKRQQAHLTLAC